MHDTREPGKLEAHFARIARHYNSFRTVDFEPIDVLAQSVFESSHAVCEIGCGTGRYLVPLIGALERSGVEVEAAWGVDPNQEMLSVANAVSDQVRETVQWVRGYADATGLPENSVTLVTSFNSFHHFPVPETLAEVQRIVKSAGYFAVYIRVREQEPGHLWGQWFPDYVKKSRVPKREQMVRLGTLNADFELIQAREFEFTREATLQRIMEQTRAKHYSTLALYPPEEFERACALFVERLRRHYPGTERIAYPVSYSLFIYRTA